MSSRTDSAAGRSTDDFCHASLEPALEVFVPFTAASLAQKSIEHAECLCSGLNARIRVLRVLDVPYPLDLDHPQVAQAAACADMSVLHSDLPITGELRMSRGWIEGFLSALPEHALVVMTRRRKFFPTAEQRLARALTRAGHRVSLFLERDRNV